MQTIDFELLFERLPSPHMVIDRDYRFVAANTAYEEVVMRPRSEFIGRNLFEVFPNDGDSGRRLKASFDRVFETGKKDTLAYIPYDLPRPAELGGGFEQRYWTAVHTSLSTKVPGRQLLLQNTVDVTELVHLTQAASMPFRGFFSGEVQLVERTREVEQQHQALMNESAEFRRMFQQAPGFIAVLSGPEHVFTFTNDAYVRLIGGRDVLGMPVREALPEIEGQGFCEMLDSVYQTGVPAGGEGTRILLRTSPDQAPTEAYLDFSYMPIRSPDGVVTGIFVQGMDRTEAVRTMQRQRLLLDELNHRVKNTLATVQSIASQTLRSARDLPSARKDFEARIIALSNAHNLLSARQWSSTDLATIVRQELALYGDRRSEVSGPPLTLNPKASIALAMLVHELSTNAAKYGALSAPEGSVSVFWRRVDHDGDETLEFCWKEQGGPAVSKPAHRGFGSRMIERVVAGELGGTLDTRFDPEGFSCRALIPGASYAGRDDAF